MEHNQLIIANCPNFYKIMNFDYYDDDTFTANLIDLYHKYIFSIKLTETELNKVHELDTVIAKYIDDYNFRKTMKYELMQVKYDTKEDLLERLINSIIGIFEQFVEGQTRKIYISRWI